MNSAIVPVAAANPVQPATRALCPPALPGYVACLALVRTDVAPLTQSNVGPNTAPPGYGPSALVSAYALPSAASGAGTGMTVAIVDAFDLPAAASYLATYRSQFGLSPCTTASGCFRKVDQNGGTTYPAVDLNWDGEIALDIEMVSATCPNCHILLVEARSPSMDDIGAAVDTAVSLGAKVISNSYGRPEFFGQSSYDAYYKHPGVAITVSSGDTGFVVQYPAASPWVTSVGGTRLSTAANTRGWIESAWSGAGSGCSAFEPKPSWQSDGGCANRTVADVSAVADPGTGVAVYAPSAFPLSPTGWVVLGGTSVASPVVAGVYALAGSPAAGTYPVRYLYAQSSQLNDVSSGSNGSCGGTYLCTAGAGYDGPTGLGTPNGTGALVANVAPGPPTTVSAVAGNATALVSWHAANANGHPITGYTVTSAPGAMTCTTAGTLSCTVGGLTNGIPYTFSVTATNSVGTGPPSASSAAVIPATVPGAPTGVAGTPGDGSALISWSAPASNGGRAITGYTATSSPLGKTCTTGGTLGCTVVGLVNGTPYTFTVTATNPVGTGPASAASPSVTPVTVAGATYVTVTPNRIVDSRGSLGGLTHLLAGTAQTFAVTGLSPGNTAVNVPDGAVAVTGNLTVTGQTAAGYFALTPAPNNVPTTSTLNFPLGDNRANGVTVALSGTGTLSVTYAAVAGNTANVLFDVTGYFVPNASGATYVTVTPNRIVDSRYGQGLATHLLAGTAKTFTVINQSADSLMVIPIDAIAVTGNLTVTGQTAAGYFALTPAPNNVPTTSTLNFPLGDNRANGVTVALSGTGTLSVTYAAVAGNTANVLFDVTGYFVP